MLEFIEISCALGGLIFLLTPDRRSKLLPKTFRLQPPFSRKLE